MNKCKHLEDWDTLYMRGQYCDLTGNKCDSLYCPAEELCIKKAKVKKINELGLPVHQVHFQSKARRLVKTPFGYFSKKEIVLYCLIAFGWAGILYVLALMFLCV